MIHSDISFVEPGFSMNSVILLVLSAFSMPNPDASARLTAVHAMVMSAPDSWCLKVGQVHMMLIAGKNDGGSAFAF